jgi:hypothetical protein
MELNIGCGATHIPGMVNADATPIPGCTDIVFDAQERWPFPAGSLSFVQGAHMFEHLPNYQGFLDAAWDAMASTALMELRMPHGSSGCAFMDPTHIRPWFPLSFVTFQPGYDVASRNGQYWHGDKRYWEIVRCLVVVRDMLLPLRRWTRGGKRRKWILTALTLFPHLCDEIIITLRPLKTPKDVQSFINQGRAGSLTVEYVCRVPWGMIDLVSTVEYMGANPTDTLQALQEGGVYAR